ncbi:MAG: hypothetical protein AAGC60_22050 [Acidobacteriota bacterium]
MSPPTLTPLLDPAVTGTRDAPRAVPNVEIGFCPEQEPEILQKVRSQWGDRVNRIVLDRQVFRRHVFGLTYDTVSDPIVLVKTKKLGVIVPNLLRFRHVIDTLRDHYHGQAGGTYGTRQALGNPHGLKASTDTNIYFQFAGNAKAFLADLKPRLPAPARANIESASPPDVNAAFSIIPGKACIRPGIHADVRRVAWQANVLTLRWFGHGMAGSIMAKPGYRTDLNDIAALLLHCRCNILVLHLCSCGKEGQAASNQDHFRVKDVPVAIFEKLQQIQGWHSLSVQGDEARIHSDRSTTMWMSNTVDVAWGDRITVLNLTTTNINDLP